MDQENDEATILVCARHQSEWLWFQSPIDFWVLDQEKWTRGFRERGFEVPDDDYAARFGIPIVDDDTVDDFLALMAEFGRLREDLEAELGARSESARSWWDIAELMPVFFVDFDARCAYSVYGENLELEKYVPAGWTGKFENFYGLIPEEQRYWVLDGIDQVERFKSRT
jgi:hypothetical protein